MTLILPSDRPIYYAVELNSAIVAAGTTQIGEATAAPHTVHQDFDENTFLGKVVGLVSDYDPLPNTGELCEAGKIYGYNGGLIICRQTHNRTIYLPEDTPALFIVYRPGGGTMEWVAGEQVEVGTHRTYDSVEYICLQAHVTQSDWTPPVVPALWQIYVEPSAEWQPGIAYKIDDEVTYQGILYKCRQAHTSQVGWEPPNVLALWLPI